MAEYLLNNLTKIRFGRNARIGPHTEDLITIKRTMRMKTILWTETVHLFYFKQMQLAKDTSSE